MTPPTPISRDELQKLVRKLLSEAAFGEELSDITCKIMSNIDCWAVQEVRQAETNAVAWTIGVIDDIHSLNGRIDSDGRLDATFKGIKNTIRDRYKDHIGVDPAPTYPVKARLLGSEGARYAI